MRRGRYRKVADRPLGYSKKCVAEQSQRLSELAKIYAQEALETLVDDAKNGRTDSARVSATNALLDLAYGKPVVIKGQDVVDLPPVVIELTGPMSNPI